MQELESLSLQTVYLPTSEISEIYATKTYKSKYLKYTGDSLLVKSSDNSNSSVVLLKTNAGVQLLKDSISLSSFSPKDVKQLVYFNMLQSDDFTLVTALGPAGTGKTTVAIAKAIDSYFKDNKPVYMTKPTHVVSSHENNAFGPVPGDISEKYAPYIGSFEIVLKKVLGDSGSHYYNLMKEREHLKFIPAEFTRGCTFEHCTFIVDEVQNMTWHELKTVLSRIGEGARIILCGDPYQIDAPFDVYDSGIYKLLTSNSYITSDFTATITLEKQYRGKIPDLVYRIDNE